MASRRSFIAKAGGMMMAATAGAIIGAPGVIAQPKIQWRLSTAWTPLQWLQRKRFDHGCGGRSGAEESQDLLTAGEQVACATFVAADQRLLRAAAGERLATVNPEAARGR